MHHICLEKQKNTCTKTLVLHKILTLIENQNVLVVAATTRIEMVDPALRRPGRLGICIEIPFPNDGDVSKIFRLYMKKYCLETILNKYLQNEKETICLKIPCMELSCTSD